jgi:hypothetical protein
MIVRLLMSLLADLIFESAASRKRSYEAEVDRYLETSGFVVTRKPTLAQR